MSIFTLATCLLPQSVLPMGSCLIFLKDEVVSPNPFPLLAPHKLLGKVHLNLEKWYLFEGQE